MRLSQAEGGDEEGDSSRQSPGPKEFGLGVDFFVYFHIMRPTGFLLQKGPWSWRSPFLGICDAFVSIKGKTTINSYLDLRSPGGSSSMNEAW
jgi:hypothetical protein